jgi:taurine dioxygenase
MTSCFRVTVISSRTQTREQLLSAAKALPSAFDDKESSVPDVAHPVVRTHPVIGRKSIYVSEGECVGIEGMPDDEALALIKELSDHCLQDRFMYIHKWRVGDLLMWDNCTAQHLAIQDYALPERRLRYRTTVNGSIPF